MYHFNLTLPNIFAEKCIILILVKKNYWFLNRILHFCVFCGIII